jgi:hypothetical protein
MAYFLFATQQLGGVDLATGGGRADFYVQFDGPDGTLPSLSLADFPTDFSAWSGAFFDFSYHLNAEDALDPSGGSGTILAVEVIPEPATAFLVGAGLAALGVRRRTVRAL